MSRQHHFHIDHRGHSVSVTVEAGHRPVVVVLVDGKETGRAETRGDRPVTVPVELPADPPVAAAVRVTPGPGVPRCLLLAEDGTDPHVMAPRLY
ncbi:hypothetical protein ACIQRS_24835 [Streptomyces termitum]|uniref:Uncharacterized protein n=1 Tax=Streptomyces termitum TaxID=67368 RepID=A0A918WAC1_9ACTN|nr:hypothetical protein [Streptomyces termitum]GHA96985.1 hypothetical protein GCM10010305_45670 [Streptomyces termitum]